MLFLYICIAVVIYLILLVAVTQIVLPYKRGTPLFPFFRKTTPLKEKVEEAEKELQEQTELAILQEELDEINRRKAQLEERKNGNT